VVLAGLLSAASLGPVAAHAAWAPGEAPAAPLPSGAPAPPGSERGRAVDVEGARVVEYDARTQQYTFRGQRVVVTRGDQRLEAPEIVYDGARRRAVLPQRGTVSTPTMELSADRITIDLAARHLLAEGRIVGRWLAGGVWAQLTAARVEVDDRPDAQRAEAAGDVIVTRLDETLRGDDLVYDRRAGRGTVLGHGVLTRGPDSLHADRIAVDLATDDAEATGHVLLERASQGMQGSADRVTYSRRAQVAVLSGHAQLSQGPNTLTADEIRMDVARSVASARGYPRIVAYPSEGPRAPAP
jgi:lipopolysaccharide transport protein LptA